MRRHPCAAQGAEDAPMAVSFRHRPTAFLPPDSGRPGARCFAISAGTQAAPDPGSIFSSVRRDKMPLRRAVRAAEPVAALRRASVLRAVQGAWSSSFRTKKAAFSELRAAARRRSSSGTADPGKPPAAYFCGHSLCFLHSLRRRGAALLSSLPFPLRNL